MILVPDRLASLLGQVNNGKARMTQRDIFSTEDPFLIRSAMLRFLHHLQD